MAPTRCIPALLLAALACAAHAQSQYAPSRPSTASRASGPTVDFDEAGNPRNGVPGSGGTAAIGADGAAAAVPGGTRAPTRTTTTQMLGAGAFGQSDGLENAVNSGTPPAWDRKSGVRKVCPPELENRNNVCVPPLGSILSR